MQNVQLQSMSMLLVTILRDCSAQPPCFSIIQRASDCSLDCKCKGQLTFEQLEEWRGRRRPEEAVGGEGLSSLCLYSRSPWEQQRLTCSIFNLISKNHAGGGSLSCVCVLSVPPVTTGRPVLCGLVEKGIYVTPGISEKKNKPDVLPWWGRRVQPGGWDGFNAMPLLDMEAEADTQIETGYFSPRKNRVICNVKCWVTAVQGRHAQAWVGISLFNRVNVHCLCSNYISLLLEVSFQYSKERDWSYCFLLHYHLNEPCP